MKIIRFIFPFLFVRNWYNGAWEFSWQRGILFGATIGLLCLGIIIAVVLQTPLVYSNI